jgi:hypothetical protein
MPFADRKELNMKRIQVLLTLLACLLATGARAQTIPGADIAELVAKVFGDHKAFTTKMHSTVQTAELGEVSTDVAYAMLDGNVRVEVNLGALQGAVINEPMLAQLKMVGMDKSYAILRNDKRKVYWIFPNIEAALVVAMPEPKDAATAIPKVEVTKLGEEKIGDRDCVKNLMTFLYADGSKQVFTVWNAPALKGFPVKIEGEQSGRKFSTLSSAVTLEKPDAKLFELPDGYKEFGNLMDLMGAAIQKMMPPPPQK